LSRHLNKITRVSVCRARERVNGHSEAILLTTFLPRDALQCKARYWDCMASVLFQ